MYFPVRRIEIEESVVDLLEASGYHRYPLDIFALARWVAWRVIPYSSLSIEKLQLAMSISKDAFSIPGRHSQIFYNDKIEPYTRQRFSLAHETMHIWLEHSDSNREAEREADYGGGYLLAPHPLIIAHELYDQVQTAFQVSGLSAGYARDFALAREREGRPLAAHEAQLIRLVSKPYD